MKNRTETEVTLKAIVCLRSNEALDQFTEQMSTEWGWRMQELRGGSRWVWPEQPFRVDQDLGIKDERALQIQSHKETAQHKGTATGIMGGKKTPQMKWQKVDEQKQKICFKNEFYMCWVISTCMLFLVVFSRKTRTTFVVR